MRAAEGGGINQSLLQLKIVFDALARGEKPGFRGEKLTEVLKVRTSHFKVCVCVCYKNFTLQSVCVERTSHFKVCGMQELHTSKRVC